MAAGRRLAVTKRSDDLRGLTAAAALWSLLRAIWAAGASLLLFLVLARMLTPEAFGTFALASLVVELGRILATAGLADAVIRRPQLDDTFADSAFWAAAALGVAAGAAIHALAPWYGDLVRDPDVVVILQALAWVLPLSALTTVHAARLARSFAHRSLAAQAVTAGLPAAVLAILAAAAGWGVWALVVQTVSAAALGLVLAWRACRWRPGLRFSWSTLAPALPLSASLLGAQLLWLLLVRVQELFIARSHGTADVGRYRVAWRLVELLSQTLLVPLGRVALVTLSRLQQDPAGLAHAYLRMTAAAALLSFPLLFGLGVVAGDLLPLLFGAQWTGVGEITAILSLMAVPLVLNHLAGPALSAVDRGGAVLKVAAIQLAATVLLTWLALPYGVAAVAAAYVLRGWLTLPLQQALLARHCGIRWRHSLDAVKPSLGAAVAMAAGLMMLRPALADLLPPGGTRLAAEIATGAALYVLALGVFGRRSVRALIGDLRAARAAP